MQGEAPYSHTVETAAASGLGQLLEALGLGDLSALSPQLLRFVKGFAPSVPWSAALGTNMTGYGMAMSQLRGSLSTAGQAVGDAYLRSDMRQTLAQLVRALNSFEDWAKRNSGRYAGITDETARTAAMRRGYESYIELSAEGLASKPFMSTIYAALAPRLGLGDPGAASADMATLTRNLARGRFAEDPRLATVASAAVARGLFGGDVTTDSTGYGMSVAPKEFSAAEWHGFSRDAIASLAAQRTRGADILSGLQLDSGQGLANGVMRLRDMMKSTAEALAPLRDVFGTDIPKMVRTIEGITGQSFASVSTSRLAALSESISNASLNGVNISDIAEQTARSAKLVAGIDRPYTALYSSMESIGLSAASMLGTGTEPVGVASSQWRSAAAHRAVSLNASSGMEYARLAYSVWRERRLREEPERRKRLDEELQSNLKALDEAKASGKLSEDEYQTQRLRLTRRHRSALARIAGVEEFSQELKERVSGGEAYDAVLRDMTGVTDLSQLEVGRAYAGYDMSSRGVALTAALGGIDAENEARGLAERLSASAQFNRALGTGSPEEARDIAMRAARAYRDNAALRTADSADYERVLKESGVADPRRTAMALRWMRTESQGSLDTMIRLAQAGNLGKASADQSRASTMRDLADSVPLLLDEGLLRAALTSGFSLDEMKRRFSGRRDLIELSTYEGDVATAIASATARVARGHNAVAKGSVTPEQLSQDISSMLRYAATTDDTGFVSALNSYRAAAERLERGDVGDGERASLEKELNRSSLLMWSYATVGSDLTGKLVDTMGDRALNFIDTALRSRGRNAKDAPAMRSAYGEVILTEQLKRAEASQPVRELALNLLDAYMSAPVSTYDKNGDGVLDLGEGFSTFWKEASAEVWDTKANAPKGSTEEERAANRDTYQALELLREQVSALDNSTSPTGLLPGLGPITGLLDQLVKYIGDAIPALQTLAAKGK